MAEECVDSTSLNSLLNSLTCRGPGCIKVIIGEVALDSGSVRSAVAISLVTSRSSRIVCSMSASSQGLLAASKH